jgi:hypothetical protein
MVKVFLSYSHDDDTHKARVHALADRLQAVPDVRVVLDRDAGPGGPDEGWPAWSERQVREADRVLIACTAVYTRRYEGNDDASDRGKGTVVEARAIQQYLYDSKGRNARFRVVVFEGKHQDDIPLQLRGYQCFNPTDDASYRELIAWLKAEAREAEGPAPEGPTWPRPDPHFTLPIADRRPHFDAIRKALSGQSSNRIFLLEGEGASGKTQFLNELSSYADRVAVPWTRFDFKGAPPIEDFFDNVLLDFGAERLRDTKAAKSTAPLLELVTDLKRFTTPVLFLFDTFEKGSEDSRSWLESKFLPRIRSLPGAIIVVGGRNVPDWSQFPWKTLAEFHKLEPINNAEDWREYLHRVHNGQLELHEIQTLTRATAGRPGNMRPLLETLMTMKRSENG